MQKPNTTMTGVLNKILFYILLMGIWELVYRIGVDFLKIWKGYTFPSPTDVIRTLWSLLLEHTLFIAVGASMQRLIVGYVFSLVIGILLGFLIIRFKYLDDNLRPLILGLQTLPSICWIPFAILWFGLNEKSIIFVIAIGSIFAISIATESAIKNINPLYIKSGKIMGASGLKLYSNVILPAALPTFVSGMKQGWSFAWRALMAGEMMAATKGLGQVLMIGRDLADISQVMAVMIVIVIIGLVTDRLLFTNAEKKIRYKWGLER